MKIKASAPEETLRLFVGGFFDIPGRVLGTLRQDREGAIVSCRLGVLLRVLQIASCSGSFRGTRIQASHEPCKHGLLDNHGDFSQARHFQKKEPLNSPVGCGKPPPVAPNSRIVPTAGLHGRVGLQRLTDFWKPRAVATRAVTHKLVPRESTQIYRIKGCGKL